MTFVQKPTRVLYLDHEGGWGGASRSLWYLISSLDRTAVSPEIWYRQAGPAKERFKSIGVAATHVPELPNITPSAASHVANWVLNARHLVGMNSLVDRMKQAEVDMFHFNYEGLAPLAWKLAKSGDRRPRILHVRFVNPINSITRAFVRHIIPVFHHVIFISENEYEAFHHCGFPKDASHSIIYNPAPTAAYQQKFSENRSTVFKVVFLGTLDRRRGADRLIEVARILKSQQADFHFDLYGKAPSYKKFLSRPQDAEERLRKDINESEVASRVRLRGHTSNPEQAILNSHLVVRPSRASDPWGRDVIEAMSLGRPIIASGRFNGFIKNGETGYLVEPWDAAVVADIIVHLTRQPEELKRISLNAKSVARRLFDPTKYAQTISAIYKSLGTPT